MQSWQLFGIGLVTAVGAVLVRQLRPDMAIPIRLTGNVVLFGAIITVSLPIYSCVSVFFDGTAAGQYVDVLLKALGVALAAHMGAEICRDCGENSIAAGVELAAKCEILLLGLPLMTSVLSTASELLGGNV